MAYDMSRRKIHVLPAQVVCCEYHVLIFFAKFFYDFLYCDKNLDSCCITGIYLVIHTVDYGNWKSIGETCFEI
jgi:hypothetical protein